ncbi:MAG: FecR domain-containing protein [Chitinophagaceae bacterium]|nr:FecR domain-containing protein [Chitinophagaceae bacterium]
MPIDKELIIKYLKKECTAAEQKEVEAFLRGPEGLQALQEAMDVLLPEDIASFKTDLPSEAEASEWMGKVHGRMFPLTEKVRPGRVLKRFSIGHAAVWIGLIVFLGLGLWGLGLFQKDKRQQHSDVSQVASMHVNNPKGRRSKITLSDGSVITLGPDSRMSYPASFSDHSREISLEGEAFFQISRDPNRSFIVHTGDIHTKVLGTSFKVEAFAGQPVSVAVATGQVRVDQYKGGKLFQQLAILNPGKKISWNGAAVTPSVLLTDEPVDDINGWVDYRLAFNAQTLREITTQLGRWYAVDIKFVNPVVADRRLTITLSANMPLQTILEVLRSGSGFTYQIKDREIIIY